MPTFALNFSRPGGQIVAQYYNFLRYGREGYREIQQACADTAQSLARRDRRDGPVRTALRRRRRTAGGRLHAQGSGARRFLVLRSLRSCADARLADRLVPAAAGSRRTPSSSGFWSATASAATWRRCSPTTSAARSRTSRAIRSPHGRTSHRPGYPPLSHGRQRVFQFLADQPFATIFLTLGSGYLLGRVSLGFFSLGSTAGSLLVALAVGASAFTLSRRHVRRSGSRRHDLPGAVHLCRRAARRAAVRRGHSSRRASNSSSS